MAIRIDGTNATANPGITGDDADTGFVFGTDEISIVTGGTEKVKIDNGALKVTGQSSGITDGGITFDWEDISQSGRIFAESSAASQFKFYTTNSSGTRAEQMRIDDAGHVTIQNGNLVLASGSGIDFSATADGTGATNVSELLADYEEGAWTPNDVSGGRTFGSNSWGLYTKIGRKVTVSCYIDANQAHQQNPTDTFEVGGLPFTPLDPGSGGFVGTPMFRNVDVEAATVNVVTYVTDTTGGIRLYKCIDNSDWDQLLNSEILSSSDFYLESTYFTS